MEDVHYGSLISVYLLIDVTNILPSGITFNKELLLHHTFTSYHKQTDTILFVSLYCIMLLSYGTLA